MKRATLRPLLTAGLTMPTAGVPRFSAVVADGRYYARMGLPIVTVAAKEPVPEGTAEQHIVSPQPVDRILVSRSVDDVPGISAIYDSHRNQSFFALLSTKTMARLFGRQLGRPGSRVVRISAGRMR